MRMRIGLLCLVWVLGTAAASAQQGSATPNPTDVYCSGVFTTENVPYDSYIISGEDARLQAIYGDRDYVYLNRGGSHGVSVGDEFLISRPVKDASRVKWFESQPALLRAMGRMFIDVGRVRVVVVHPEVSIAQVVSTCEPLNRGDYARPFAQRPAPPYKPVSKFDRFAAPSGKPVAMVVASRHFRQLVGTHDVVYVNLGSEKGVQVGDYIRIFRYQGTRHDTAYLHRGYQYKMYGFGSTPQRFDWDDLPREVLGEGIVLRVSPRAATVLITYAVREIYLGDYIEIQ